MLLHLLIAVIAIALCWKWGDWKNWRSYYPTILYFVIGDITAYMLLQNKPLWVYEGLQSNYFLLDFYYATAVYPSLIILYLTHYPKKAKKQFLYLAFCIAIFVLFEGMLNLFGLFSYYNGWNLGYSAIFDVLMFFLLRLHYKKALIVWPISLVLAVLLLWIFQIPIWQ